MAVAVHSEKLRVLVDENAEVEQVATGFTFTEGPIWHPDGYLLFSDMPGDVRRKYTPGQGVEEVLRPSCLQQSRASRRSSFSPRSAQRTATASGSRWSSPTGPRTTATTSTLITCASFRSVGWPR
jgi:sugar lactone lactonase YvrE